MRRRSPRASRGRLRDLRRGSATPLREPHRRRRHLPRGGERGAATQLDAGRRATSPDPLGAPRRRTVAGAPREDAMSSTLFEKIWGAHEVTTGLQYVDLHLVHEVTSPQAFEALRLAGRGVRRPDRTLATADHNPPTDGTPTAARIKDLLSREQVQTLERNCAEFGVPVYSLGSDRQGIVHVIGPELGVTQPGMTIVCGDSHTSTHG